MIAHGILFVAFFVSFVHCFQSFPSSSLSSTALKAAAAGDSVPSATVDIVESDGSAYTFKEAQDFGAVLKSHKKAVLFAVPGAFTPTCSGKHLPGFIEQASKLEGLGVEAIYCLSVNDKYVMRAWGQATEGCVEQKNLKLVADGNGDFVKALKLVKDGTGSRMGIRSMRFAAVIENGVFSTLAIDEKGLEKSSAEDILSIVTKTCSL